MLPRLALPVLAAMLAAACAAPAPQEALKGHLSQAESPASPSGIPSPVRYSLALPPPRNTPRTETYSVVVNNVPVRDLLFALARDAKVNVDIHPGISGAVTLNAVNQTLPQLLARLAKQVDIRYEMDGPNLAIMPDAPFLRHYKIDYVNMGRNVTGTMSTNTQIATAQAASGASGAPPMGGGAGSISNTRIENASRNQFWDSLEKNIKDLLRETDKILPDGSSETVVEQNTSQSATGVIALPLAPGRRSTHAAQSTLQGAQNGNSSSQAAGNSIVRHNTFREAASVIMNAETGVVAVRATQRQHERIQEFLDRVLQSARRQVLIEATIIEVALKDSYQQGINWTQLAGGGMVQFIGNTATRNAYNLQYTRGGNPDALVTLLDTFGSVRVLSSPRLSVLNNQTALLKVVENYVYFNVKADTTTTANVGTNTTYTTTPQSVSVGLVVSVTPQIGDNDTIVLNVRPTITSVAREVADPNPDLAKNQISNLVPVIRTREIESVMRIPSGSIAILGGLMEDRTDWQNQRVPLLGQIPAAGELFNNRSNSAQKTELVVFLRPVVIRDASLEGDYAPLRKYLPDERFFSQEPFARALDLQLPRRRGLP